MFVLISIMHPLPCTMLITRQVLKNTKKKKKPHKKPHKELLEWLINTICIKIQTKEHLEQI